MTRDPTHDLANLFRAHDQVARWRAERENASARLELETIKERMWELHSQHQPLGDLCGANNLLREKILAHIFYVVVGRFPETKS